MNIFVHLGIDSKSPPIVCSVCRLTIEKNIEFPAVLTGLPHSDLLFNGVLARIDRNIALSRGGDRAATLSVKADVKIARQFYRDNALFAQGVARAADDVALPVKMGYDLFKDRTAVKSVGFRLTQKASGEVLAEIDAVPTASAYVWGYLVAGKWILAAGTKHCEYLFKGLTPLVATTFRYAPITGEGQGLFVESASFMVT